MQTILSIKGVCQATSLSRATVYRLVKSGEFPKPVSITVGRVGWYEPVVDQWVRKKIAVVS